MPVFEDMPKANHMHDMATAKAISICVANTKSLTLFEMLDSSEFHVLLNSSYPLFQVWHWFVSLI